MDQDKAKTLVDRYRKVRSEYDASMSNLHQEIANYAMPRKSNVTHTKTPGTDDWTEGVYDDEAINGTQVLAAGQLDMIFSGRWIEGESPWPDAPESIQNWYRRCGEIMLETIHKTNFRYEIHEFLLDRSCFATSHLHCEEDDEDILFFMNDDVGEYVVEDNEKGVVDKWWGCRKFTADQAVSKWGKEKVGKSVLEAYEQENGKGRSTEFEFIFFIGPREYSERLYGSKAAKDKPWAYIVVQTKDDVVVEEGGYDEKPYIISRYLKWGRSPYGFGPAMITLPSIKEVNGGEKLYSVLCELQAFPRMLVPHDLEGMVGYGPSGVTIFNAATGSKPEEWATDGRGDIFQYRLESLRAKIRRAFHVELFQMLTNMDEVKREKTAYEVQAMLAEKISHFTPTFYRLEDDMRPMLQRIFSICWRKRLFPQPPPEIVEFTGTQTLQFPKFVYTSKLAKAISASENRAFSEFLSYIGQTFELFPTVFEDEINPKRTLRRIGYNSGMPQEMFNTDEEREQIKGQREARQAAAEQMALAEQASKAASNLSRVPQLVK